jgi:hypothetical protein
MKKKKKRTKIGEAEELKTSRGGGMPETNLSGVTQEGSEESSQTNWAAGHILNASKSIEKKENGGKKNRETHKKTKSFSLTRSLHALSRGKERQKSSVLYFIFFATVFFFVLF